METTRYKYGSKNVDTEMTVLFNKNNWRKCPHCGSRKHFHYIDMFSTLHNDGQWWCEWCESYLGMWDKKADMVIN